MIQYCPLCKSNTISTKHKLSDYDILGCINCNLLFQYPIPSPEKLLRIYDNEEYWRHPYFRNCTINYERDSKVRMYEWALERLNKHSVSKGKLLDIGCGTGVFLDIARKHGWTVQGVEVSTFGSNYAISQFTVDVIKGSIEEIELLHEYQVITLWDVIEHCSSPLEVMDKLVRSLDENGIILIFTPNAASLVRKMAPLLDRLLHPSKSFVEMVYSPLHIYYFSCDSIKRMIDRYSMHILDIHQFPMSPDRARHGTPFSQKLLRLIDKVGGLINREYRFLIFAQKVSKV